MSRADSSSPSSTTPPPAQERRRAARVYPGPLRVRLHRTCEGFLLSISAVGALMRLPASQAAEKRIKFVLEWNAETLELAARVVRSTPHAVTTSSATLARTEYHVAVEFVEISPPSAPLLEQLLKLA